jgi:hypothetical protein
MRSLPQLERFLRWPIDIDEGTRSLSEFFKRRDVLIALAFQLLLSIFLAHGYDFRVEYVAGRNIVDGGSPYSGGTISGWMALGWGPQVQGIGETPLWALYLGLCYSLSAGQPFVFNFLSKIPIIVANVSLAYFSYSRGIRGWRFFLLNVYLITTSVTWGKPDNLATILAIGALIATDSATASALFLSASFMIKPLAVAILPAFVLRLMHRSLRWGATFTIGTLVLSTGMFLSPFILLSWPLVPVINGFSTWFGHVGALSVFNLITVENRTELLPPAFWWVGYIVVIGTGVLIAYAIIRKPEHVLQYALLSAAVFFTLRPWNSEQNLVLLLAIFVLLRGALPSRWLWVIPLMFAVANNSLQQQLYLLMPTIVGELDSFYAPFNIYRLWLKFVLAFAWLIILWFNVTRVRNSERSNFQQSKAVQM